MDNNIGEQNKGQGATKKNKQLILIGVMVGVAAAAVLIMIFAISGVFGSGEKSQNDSSPGNNVTDVMGDTNNDSIDLGPGVASGDSVAIEEKPMPTPVPTLSPEEIDYKKAKSLLSNKEYKKAAALFDKLGKYKNSKELYKKSRYRLGIQLYKKKQYNKAKKEFDSLKKYKQSRRFSNLCVARIFTGKSIRITGWENIPDPIMCDEIIVKWSKDNGADGYELYYEIDWFDPPDQNGTKRTKNTRVSIGTVNFDFVISIHAKVRAYKKIGGKTYYTKWSSMSDSPWHYQ